MASNRYAEKNQIEIWREFLSELNPLVLSPDAFRLYQFMMSKIEVYDEKMNKGGSRGGG